MASTSYMQLKGITNIGNSLINNQLEHGIISFFQWGLLNKGGFYNNNSSNNNQLRYCQDPRYTDGKVWEGQRIDWVWESGLDEDPQPIAISGVEVGGTFYPTATSGTNAHYIDYPNGRVVFNTAIPTTSTVRCNHSFRWAMFTTADAEWFKRILTSSHTSEGMASSSGNRDFGESRVQLPAVAVEAVPSRSFVPLQLGGGQILFQDVTMTIIAESSWERNQLTDFISYQNNMVFYLYDINQVLADGKYPLDERGMLVNGDQYPDLINNDSYRFKRCQITETRITETGMIGGALFGGVVRFSIRIEMPELV